MSISMLSLIFMGWSITVWVTECFYMQTLFGISSGDGQIRHLFPFYCFSITAFVFDSLNSNHGGSLIHTSAFNRKHSGAEHAATFALSGTVKDAPPTLTAASCNNSTWGNSTWNTDVMWKWDRKSDWQRICSRAEHSYVSHFYMLCRWADCYWIKVFEGIITVFDLCIAAINVPDDNIIFKKHYRGRDDLSPSQTPWQTHHHGDQWVQREATGTLKLDLMLTSIF